MSARTEQEAQGFEIPALTTEYILNGNTDKISTIKSSQALFTQVVPVSDQYVLRCAEDIQENDQMELEEFLIQPEPDSDLIL